MHSSLISCLITGDVAVVGYSPNEDVGGKLKCDDDAGGKFNCDWNDEVAAAVKHKNKRNSEMAYK